jgi:hypothetical protein
MSPEPAPNHRRVGVADRVTTGTGVASESHDTPPSTVWRSTPWSVLAHPSSGPAKLTITIGPCGGSSGGDQVLPPLCVAINPNPSSSAHPSDPLTNSMLCTLPTVELSGPDSSSLKLVRQVFPPSAVPEIVEPLPNHPTSGETNCSRDLGCGENSGGRSVVVDVVVDGAVRAVGTVVMEAPAVDVRGTTFAPDPADPFMMPQAARTSAAAASATATAATAATMTPT